MVIPAPGMGLHRNAEIQPVVTLTNMGLGPSRRWGDGTPFSGPVNYNSDVPAEAVTKVFATS